MSSSDFRHIAFKGEAGKAERLFRASVSAFCSLTRPSRREIAQLEDLTLPLFDMVSVESRRFVAAALSECEYAPGALIRRLCDEAVDIAAPLLIRSRALTDIDLIALIGRHGLSHARAIARRPGLNPTIAQLVRALDRPVLVAAQPVAEKAAGATRASGETAATPPRRAPVAGMSAADNARRRLRSMMRPARNGDTAGDTGGDTRDDTGGDGLENGPDLPLAVAAYAKLRDPALTGSATFFQTALASALDIGLPAARSITQASSHFSLIVALRALDLSEEKAFLVAAAVFPGQFAHAEAIRLFLERYRALDRQMALDRIRRLKAETIAASVQTNRPAACLAGNRQATAPAVAGDANRRRALPQ